MNVPRLVKRLWDANGSWVQRRSLALKVRFSIADGATEAGKVMSGSPRFMKDLVEEAHDEEVATPAKSSQDFKSTGTTYGSGGLADVEDEGEVLDRKKHKERMGILKMAISEGRERAERELKKKESGKTAFDSVVDGEDEDDFDSEHGEERVPKMSFDLKTKFKSDPYENRNEPLPVYPATRGRKKRARQIMKRLNRIESLGMKNSGRAVVAEKLPHLRKGDVVRIKHKDLYSESGTNFFTGAVIQCKRNGTGSSFVVRNAKDDLTLERGFHTHSPTIVDAKIVSYRKVGKRSILYLKKGRPALSDVGIDPLGKDPTMTIGDPPIIPHKKATKK
ncbi:hypothetical protein NDN08_004078 [Rhodosorus marinus]|uniref:50S ribosomal protein L19 n=1 Tax=Rhodosorus marinus TaxID=101924 RepID=A0AAV8UJX5_9RHOD|nr:hypothetical protein NDN08_004078 [Rhodosorus marinus]